MATFYDLLVKKNGFAGKLVLNDVPIEVWHTADADTHGAVANLWMPGKMNRVRFDIDWPADLKSFHPRIDASVKTTAERRGSLADATEIGSLHWTPNSAELVPGESVEFTFTANDPPPSALWGALRPIALDERVRAEVLALIAELHAALASRDLERTSALLRFKSLDTYSVMYLSAAEAAAGLRDFYSFFFDDPAWEMEPLNPDRIELHLVGDQRIVWATRPHFEPLFQSVKTAELRLLLAVYMASVEGKFTIVR